MTDRTGSITPDSPATALRGLTDEQIAEIRAAMDEREVRAASIIPPACPDWCTRPAGHEYTPERGDNVEREHEADISNKVAVFATETRTGDGQVTTTPALVIVSDVEYERFTSETTREFGLDLTRAALLCEQINGGAR